MRGPAASRSRIRGAIPRSPSIPSAHGRVPVAFAPVAAIAWLGIALTDLAVRVLLFRVHRTPGTMSTLWGLGFALFLWAGLRSIGLGQTRAIVFALVAGAGITLFVYLRGAALESPPVERPGAFLRRLRAGRAPRPARRRAPGEPRDRLRAEIAIDDRDFDEALYWLREAARVAVAQRKLDELLEVRARVDSIRALGFGETSEAAGRLAWRIEEDLRGFPADALAAAGVHVQTDADLLELVLARRARPAGDGAEPVTPELGRARAALGRGDLAAALFDLQEAERVAVAQRRLDELLEVYGLARELVDRSDGRTRAAAERLLAKAETGLLSFAPARA